MKAFTSKGIQLFSKACNSLEQAVEDTKTSLQSLTSHKNNNTTATHWTSSALSMLPFSGKSLSLKFIQVTSKLRKYKRHLIFTMASIFHIQKITAVLASLLTWNCSATYLISRILSTFKSYQDYHLSQPYWIAKSPIFYIFCMQHLLF